MTMLLALQAACSSPTHAPRPLSPRRAKEGANRRIWPCFFREDVHVVRSVAGSVTETARPRPFLKTKGYASQLLKNASCTTGQTAGTSSLRTHGQIRLLAPLSAPAGEERGEGDRGGRSLDRGEGTSTLRATTLDRAVRTHMVGEKKL